MGRGRALILTGLLLLGCSEPSTLLVDVRTDLVPGAEFDRAQVQLLDAAGDVVREAESTVEAGDDFVAGRRVGELDQVSGARATFRVSLWLGDREIIARPVRVDLTGGAVAHTVVFTRDCLGVVCEDAARAACLSGECVPDVCTEEAPCLEPECGANEDCAASVACAAGRCEAGVCFEVTARACPAGGTCDLERGCTHPEWPAVQSALQQAAAQGSSMEPTFRTFPVTDPPSGGSRWVGGVLAPNGRIYGMPFNAGVVLEIDPDAGTARTFGSVVGVDAYVGGVLGLDGFVYGIPLGASQVLRIDPDAGTATRVGPDLGDGRHFAGGVVGPDGRIWMMPANDLQVGVFDPSTETLERVGPMLPPTGHKYRGAVVSPSGLIVGIPARETRLLRIDPVTDEVRLFGEVPSLMRSWYGGVVTPDGRVLGLPLESPSLLVIDPLAETVEVVPLDASPISTTGAAGALAPNGRVYIVPNDPSTIREIDPVTLTSRELGDLGAAGGKWIGAVLGLDGRVYGIPWNSTEVLVIDPHASGTLPPEITLSRWLDKL